MGSAIPVRRAQTDAAPGAAVIQLHLDIQALDQPERPQAAPAA